MTAAAPIELREGEADLGDIRLHYVESGPPSAPLVLMLHGFPQFWWLWQAQLNGLGTDFRVVAPDMPGYNLSSKPQEVESYRMRHLLADVDGLVEHLGGGPFTLVGHDWGGIVAWAFACRGHPELERLVILDGVPPWTWGRELERSAAQRSAVRYMVELGRPAPHGEELAGANDFAVLDSLMIEPGIGRGYLSESDRARYHEAWSQPGGADGRPQLLPGVGDGGAGRGGAAARGARAARADAGRGAHPGDLGLAGPHAAARAGQGPGGVGSRTFGWSSSRERGTGRRRSARTRSTA